MVPARKIRSACLRFLPAPLGAWVCKILILLRFTDCAWVCRANAPGAYSGGRPKGLPYPIPEGFLENRRGGAEGESAEGREKPPWDPSRGPASVQPLRKQRGRDQIRRRGGPCGRLYSRCESWRAHAMRPYWFPVDCRGGYQPPVRAFPLQGEGRFPLSGGNVPKGQKG